MAKGRDKIKSTKKAAKPKQSKAPNSVNPMAARPGAPPAKAGFQPAGATSKRPGA
jgi:hypothetical protein